MPHGLAILTSLLGAPVWLLVLHPWWRIRASGSGPWVIGGHRGRAYADNSAAVEAAARRAGRSIVWIANNPLAAELRDQGLDVRERNSWAARRAISRAGALIYSHGEDDLDLLMILLRGRTALRFYLGHSLSLLKAGGVTEPKIVQAKAPFRWLLLWLITDFDAVLCASEKERSNFRLCYPRLAENTLLGGGAHLDNWSRGGDLPPKRRIYWFPTFRDTEEASIRLQEKVADVCASAALRAWLVDNGYEFFIGAHINAGGALDKLNFEAPFVRADLKSLEEDIRESELLISDYSGVVFDFLLLGRPQILFAFDLQEYRVTRHLYQRLDTLDFALHPRTSDELCALLVGEEWRCQSLSEAALRWRKECLPPQNGDFALASLRAMDDHLRRHS